MISDNVEFLRIVVAILKMATSRNCSMSGINSGHHYLPTYQILMISDNVEFLRWWPFWKWWPVEIVQCRESIRDIIIYPHIKLWWYRTMLNFCVLWPFWKWRPVEIVQCRESIRDIIIYPHIKLWWYRTMLNFCGIVVAILKMATSRNCSMSGINSGHHYLPTYQIVMISDNVEFLRWRPVEIVQCRESIQDIIIYHISNFDDIGQCWIFAVLWWPFWKWRPVEIVQCRDSCWFGTSLSRNCSMSTYQIVMISDNVEFLRYCDGHFKNGDR